MIAAERELNESSVHGTSKDECAICARDDDRARGWVRVQQALLRDGSPEPAGSDLARGDDIDRPVLRADIDSRVLGALLHRAETATSRVKYLVDRGPAVSIPQHRLDLSSAREAEQSAWASFKAYAANGTSSPDTVEIAQRLHPRAR